MSKYKEIETKLAFYLKHNGHPWVETISISGTTVTVYGVEYSKLTFAMLDALSKEFQTSKIDVGSETRRGGYCETCDYSYTVPVITVYEAKIPEV